MSFLSKVNEYVKVNYALKVLGVGLVALGVKNAHGLSAWLIILGVAAYVVGDLYARIYR